MFVPDQILKSHTSTDHGEELLKEALSFGASIAKHTKDDIEQIDR